MKPTILLKKLSIAGVLASCIFLVNCGSAKDDPQAQIAAQVSADKALPACSDETMKLLKERSDLFSTIRDILGKPLDDAQKETLQNSVFLLSGKSQTIKANVRESKVAGFPATACIYKNAETEIKYDLSVIKAEDLTLAKRVSKANDDKANEILLQSRPTWKAGDKLKISAELAQMITNDSFVSGKRMIYDGKVVNGGADFQLVSSKRDSSFCITAVVDGQGVTSEDTPEIGNISARLDNKGRIVQDLTLLVPSMAGKRSLLLSCVLADKSDLNDAMVDAFGSLLLKQGEL